VLGHLGLVHNYSVAEIKKMKNEALNCKLKVKKCLRTSSGNAPHPPFALAEGNNYSSISGFCISSSSSWTPSLEFFDTIDHPPSRKFPSRSFITMHLQIMKDLRKGIKSLANQNRKIEIELTAIVQLITSLL